MNVTDAQLVISAVSKKQYPNEPLPEIALAGRSNVGKSSFINRMIQRKSLARTSSKPGKTQTLNFYKINNELFFVDVPGYGYAKVSKSEREKWGRMMEEYFTQRETLRATVLLIDMRHPPTEDDMIMYDFLKHYEIPVIVVCTKLDKVNRSKRQKHLKIIKEDLDLHPDDPIIPFSSETGEGKDEAWKALMKYIS